MEGDVAAVYQSDKSAQAHRLPRISRSHPPRRNEAIIRFDGKNAIELQLELAKGVLASHKRHARWAGHRVADLWRNRNAEWRNTMLSNDSYLTLLLKQYRVERAFLPYAKKVTYERIVKSMRKTE